jgi:hypothetical protein
MHKTFLLMLALGLAVVLVPGVVPAQPAGPGSRGGWYCPWMRGPQAGPPVAQPGKPLSKDQAKAMVEPHMQTNPNLKVGKVTEKNGVYEVDVVTKDGSLVDKIQVNKQTGWFRSAYERLAIQALTGRLYALATALT